MTWNLDHSVLAAGADLIPNIGRDLSTLIAASTLLGVGIVGWVLASKRAAASERRLNDLDERLDGPSVRELCAELSKIITPYRESRFGRPVEDRLTPERRFLRNLHVQLRLSRKRRQRIEAMHNENLTQCAKLREDLEAIRRDADAAAVAIANATSVPAPATPSAIDEALTSTDSLGDASNTMDNNETPSTPAASPEPPAIDDSDVAEAADLVFSALDEQSPTDSINEAADDETAALFAGEEPADGPAIDSLDEDASIDFDSLLAESAAKIGADPIDDESLGGVAAFEKQLADAGYGSKDAQPAESSESASLDATEAEAPEAGNSSPPTVPDEVADADAEIQKKKSKPDEIAESDSPSSESQNAEATDAPAPEASPIDIDMPMADAVDAVESLEPVLKARAEIDAAIARAETSREALEKLDASLDANLKTRRDMIERIDSALNERQIQLVTDILRAEAEHLSLTEALGQIRASVDAIQADLKGVIDVGADKPSGE